MVRTAYKALAAALLKSLNMSVSEAKGGGHGLLASPLDTPLGAVHKLLEVPRHNFARARLTISLASLVTPKGVILV